MPNPVKFLVSLLVVAASFCLVSSVQAATKTICRVGCDYTSISQAFSMDGAPDEVYEVQGGAPAVAYNVDDETWDIHFPDASSTLMCTGGAIISQPGALVGFNRIYLTSNSTLQNCTLGNVQLATAAPIGSDTATGFIIRDNTFQASATGTIEFSSSVDNFLISNNTNIHHLAMMNTSTNGIVQDNSFYGDSGAFGSTAFDMAVTSTNIQIIHNDFLNYTAHGSFAQSYVNVQGENIVFASNTVRAPVVELDGALFNAVSFKASGTTYIAGNFVDAPTKSSNCNGISIVPLNDNAITIHAYLQHNTIRVGGGIGCNIPAGIAFQATTDRPDANFFFNIDYNLIFNASSTPTNKQAIAINYQPTNVVSQSNSYNGAYGFDGGVVRTSAGGGGGGGGDVSDATSLTAYPALEIDDVDTDNDLVTAPFSQYLDINGTEDIGATSAVRRNTISIDQTGIVNYGAVDAVSTAHLGDFLRTGDTVTLAAGTYTGFNVGSAYATSSISISGAGTATIIQAQTDQDAVTFTSVSSSQLSNLTVRDASSASHSYTANNFTISYSGTDYNEEITSPPGPGNIPAGSSFILTSGSSCDVDIYQGDGHDITSNVGDATHNWHVAAVSIGGFYHETVLVPDNIATSQGDFNAICGGDGIMADAFYSDVFVHTALGFTYDSAALTGGIGGATVISGTPAINRITSSHAGLSLTGSTNGITITGVTSTNNLIGINFATTANGNNQLVDSVLVGNSTYDVDSASNVTNTFDNVSFDRSLARVTGSAPISVKYDVRLHAVRRGTGSAISGLSASAMRAGGPPPIAFSATDGSGYTSYLSLDAHDITSLSNSLTNGSHNPYTFSLSGTGYAASSTVETIDGPNQTYQIAMIPTTAPSTPVSPVVTSLTTTGGTFIWTDTSGDVDYYMVDYRRPLIGETYPASLVYVSADATGTSVGSLIPGETYEFRVAAANSYGTSTNYATSTSFTLPAAVPGVPVVTALSRTSLSVGIDTNSNATSVTYAIYSPTLSSYLDASGAATTVPVFQSSSTWATPTVSGLTCGTSYSFVAIGQNSESVLTATSTAGTVSTSACATVVSSGGGGGGGGGAIGSGGGGGAIQVFFPLTTTPVPSTSNPPVVSTPVTSEPVVPPVTPVTTPETPAPTTNQPVVTLQDFLNGGSTPASRALGAGERAAILRDARETMGRTDIPVDDLERIANGQIPRTRSLAYERSIAPRALVTFRTIFGHAPNFRNQTENLAWNTLMYRLRFPRNLAEERQGIQAFQRAFRIAPSSPFQWAVVRVMGYLR